MEGDVYPVCQLHEEVTGKVIAILRRLSNDRIVAVREIDGWVSFSHLDPMSENHRAAWEKVITGLVELF